MPQGTSLSSTNYEFDYVSFHKAVRKVIRTGLRFTDEELQLDDPVKKRRVYSEHLKKLLDRIETVVKDEADALSAQIEILKQFIDLEELEEASDIEELVKQISKFYSQAQTSHVGISVHYDASKINSCKKNSGQILSSIKNAQQIIETKEPVEALIRLSRDPMQGLKTFVKLLAVAGADVEKADHECELRMKNKNKNTGDDSSAVEVFRNETDKVKECRSIIEEVKKNHVIG